MEYKLYKPDELTHWGVLGMKWGVRRYQNKDGSLTAAGKRRIKAESAAIKKESEILKNRKATKAKFDRLAAKRKALEDEKRALDEAEGVAPKKGKKGGTSASKATAPAKKTIEDMTDEELATAVNRARLEDAYRQLRPEQVNEKHPFMKKMVDEVVVPSAINSGRQLLQNTLNDLAAKAMKGKVDPNSLEALKATYDKLDYKNRIDKILNPDKHLSEEDKSKRQEREFKAADRKSKLKGYADQADEAAQKRAAKEASRKAAADEAARAANDSTSRQYYDSVYRNKGTGQEQVGSKTERGLTIYNPPKTAVSLVQSSVNKSSNTPVTSLSSSTINSGKSAVDSNIDFVLMDTDGTVLRRWND